MILNRIIPYSFYLLFFLTPLFWTSLNYELFEFNKMILTYGITTLIVGAWVLKSINEKRLTIKQTPLDIPLLLFLGANILSTIFSIDIHTSIWGYYSRSNGGLLSLIAYLLLYFAFVSNMNKAQVLNVLKFGLASGFIISLWGIFEHFGVSPSCILLRGEFNASCWVQDVAARVFASLGQPNWLAAYLAMLIFPALYFFMTATAKKFQVTYYLLLITLYLGFTFTYSRGPTLGLIGGMVIFFILYLKIFNFQFSIFNKNFKLEILNFKLITLVLISFLAINLLFGSALTSFRLVSKFAAPVRPAIALPTSGGTQLENGGTESGQIRFIVWKGALDIWKANPILGSGLETFAYSYYQFRPTEHNQTSEWDFLYNKSHNEYLNYLSTTGIVGFGTYMIVIITFLIWSILKIFNFQFSIFNKNFKFQISNSKNKLSEPLIIVTILASYTSYLIYNFFLFSVVIIAIFFYLFPALVFVVTDSTKILNFKSNSLNLIYKKPVYTRIAKGLVILSTLYLLYSIIQLWYADTLFSQGEKASDLGNPGKAYNLISEALDLRKDEPFYRSELAFSAAQAAVALEQTDATLSADLKEEATTQMEAVLSSSPKNVSFWRSAIRTYFELASLDKSYIEKTLAALDHAISLAPTDPKLYYNKALILDSKNAKQESIAALETALKLKPDYPEALAQLKEATTSAK